MLALALFLQAASPPIARIVVKPSARLTITAGDTIRLRAEAFDSAGRPVPDARIVFGGVGARFEGSVDSSGLVRSGSTGTIPLVVLASVGGGRPVVEQGEIRMVPGPAVRVELAPNVGRLVVGQRIPLVARGYSK